jgi:hypothetical protein
MEAAGAGVSVGSVLVGCGGPAPGEPTSPPGNLTSNLFCARRADEPALRHGRIKIEHIERIGPKPIINRPELRYREPLGGGDGLADGMVGLAEGEALADEVVGEIGGQEELDRWRRARQVSGRIAVWSSMPARSRVVAPTVSAESKSGSLSSCRSRL